MESWYTVNESSSMTHLNNWVNCYKLFIAYTNIRSLRWSRVTRWMSHVTWLILNGQNNSVQMFIAYTNTQRNHITWWMSRAIYESVRSRMDESSIHRWYENDMSHMNELFHIRTSHVTYESVLSRMNESWIYQWYEWVMSHMSESCHTCTSHVTYQWVMSRMNESCHVWMSQVTYAHVHPLVNTYVHASRNE